METSNIKKCVLQTNQVDILKISALKARYIIEKGKAIISNDMCKYIADEVFPGNKFGYLRVKRFLGMEEVQKLTAQAVMSYYIDKGLDSDFTIGLIKKAAELASREEDIPSLIKIFDRLALIHTIAGEKINRNLNVSIKGNYPEPGNVNKLVTEIQTYTDQTPE